VVLGVVLVFGAGLYAASQVQQDLLPDISIPAVIVITPYPGASPDIVDAQVTVPVVNALQGVTGAETVQSTSSQGVSLAIVLFKDGTDLKAAQQDVNAAVARAKPFLPPQAPASTVQTFSTNSIPILGYAVSADEPLGDHDHAPPRDGCRQHRVQHAHARPEYRDRAWESPGAF